MRASLRIARIALMSSLSCLGALIKIPSPTGTVAFDSMPGYLAALLWGYHEGGLIAFLGHIFTAAFPYGKAPFPLGLLHLVIALGMAAAACIFRYASYRFGWLVGIFTSIIFNGVLLPLVVIPVYGVLIYFMILPSLIAGSALNVWMAYVIYRIAERIMG